MDCTKICKTCGIERKLEEFKKESRCHGGYTPHCKSCINEKNKLYRLNNHTHYLERERIQRSSQKRKEYEKQWWAENRVDQNEKARQRYQKDKTPYLLRSKQQKERDPDGYRAYIRKWHRENKEWSKSYYHTVLKKDINWRIRNNLRGSLRKALNGQNKTCSVLKYLGCSIEFFKGYIEAKFKGEMKWSNYGTLWHIDHITPCKAFDLANEKDRKACFVYMNLQPLLVSENCSKQDRLPNGELARNQLTFNPKPIPLQKCESI